MIDYNKSSIQLALDMINKQAGTLFRQRDIEFKDIKYLEQGLRNTEATLVPAKNSGYQDPVTIQYDRINLNTLFRFGPIKIIPAYQKRLSEYLPIINDKYGFAFTVEDIEDGLIPEDIDPPFNLTIKFKETNPAFYGTLEIMLTNEQKSIRKLVDGLDFMGIPYPTLDKTKLQGPLYFYDSDWSELADTFSLYFVNTIVDKYFIQNVNLNDTNVWVDEKKVCDFNLHNAKFIFNGEIGEGNEYSHRQDKTHVLVVEPDPMYCKNISGYLTFHYNQSPT